MYSAIVFVFLPIFFNWQNACGWHKEFGRITKNLAGETKNLAE
jgi:hypothetical protein